MKSFFRFLGLLNNKILLSITVISFGVGFVTNHFFPTDLFAVKFILLLSILNILVLTLKHLDKFVLTDFLKASHDPILSAEKLKLKNGILSSYNIPISLTVSLFFIIVSVYLRFINYDITGYVSLFLLFVTIFVSIIGYLIYVQIIHFLYRLSKSDIDKYSKFHPAYTGWLIDITKRSAIYQNAFFVSGTLYLLLFSIHAPNETIKLFSFREPYSSNDIVLIVAWAVIVLAVVIGFPVTAYLKGKMIRSIITNLKIKSSEYYESIAERVEIGKKPDYIKVINEIMDSADYPIKTRFNIALASFTSILNVIIAIQKVYPQIFK